jgi:hypothetical protein
MFGFVDEQYDPENICYTILQRPLNGEFYPETTS